MCVLSARLRKEELQREKEVLEKEESETQLNNELQGLQNQFKLFKQNEAERQRQKVSEDNARLLDAVAQMNSKVDQVNKVIVMERGTNSRTKGAIGTCVVLLSLLVILVAWSSFVGLEYFQAQAFYY